MTYTTHKVLREKAAWEGADIQRTDSVGLASDVGGMDGTELRPTRNVNEDKLI